MHLGDNLCMNNKQAEKKFPLYFNNFEIPEWAREQELEVFRACATGKVDSERCYKTCSWNMLGN